MLSAEEASNYAKLLHPAFAGFYRDGTISESDALASIFHLIKQGNLEPEFKDNNITRGIAFIRSTRKAPVLIFEKDIIKIIFQKSNHVSSSEIGGLIKSGSIQQIIAKALNAKSAQAIPLFNSDSTNGFSQIPKKMYLNKDMYLDPENSFTTSPSIPTQIGKWIYVVTAVIIILITKMYLESALWVIVALIVIIGVGLDLWFSKSVRKIKLTRDTHDYYDPLIEFIAKHPPKPHDFTYDYIPYAIAFEIDKSWHDDFGLESGITITANKVFA